MRATRSRVRTTSDVAHACEITVWTPLVAGGARPPRPSLLLPSEPAREPLSAHGAHPFSVEGTFVRARVEFPEGTSFYGAGEVPGALAREGREVVFWNTDAYEYEEDAPSLYQSHPYVLAVLPDGSAVGLLADCIRRGAVRAGDGAVELRFEAEPFDLYRIEGAHPLEVTRGLAALVGTTPLPPLWALGYHQCRWSYSSADEAYLIASEFRRRGIPCDAVWLDIDYMDRFRVFTWNRAAFPDPAGLTGRLHAKGVKVVAILDPGVVIDEADETYASGLAGGHFVRYRNGRLARGEVWPGICCFPDFTRERTREWWAGRAAELVEAAGLDGLWIDMNEPGLLKGATKTLSEKARHAGVDGSGGDHARWHNLYGQLAASATHAGLERALPERRPFVLTRSNHVSGARVAATWTGDNQSRWDHMRWSIPMTLSLGLCGQPFAGADVPGFQGNPTPELFVRWFTLAALLPFFRGHAQKVAGRKEPWVFGEPAMLAVKAAIELRMRLLPTIYTLFREAEETGAPVVRPVFFADPSDPELRAIDDAFLLGDALLVAPVVQEGETSRRVRLPRIPGGWCSFSPGDDAVSAWHEGGEIEVEAPLGALPLFARAGSIVVACEPAPSAAAGFGETLTFHVFTDPSGRAVGRLYEDRGEGHEHRAGEYRDARIEAEARHGRVEVAEHATGTWRPPTTRRRIVVRARRGTIVREGEAARTMAFEAD